jgi:signal transduction histidine kinase
MSATSSPGTFDRSPAWLWRLYDYIGAHTNPLRAENERDRARQRVAMPAVAVAWVYGFHLITGSAVMANERLWMIAATMYAASALAFWVYLKVQPDGGVHAQYAFLALDPMIIGWALYAAPQLLAWFLVLMLVTIVRVGFRYGLNAMKVELGFAWLGVSLPLIFGAYWHSELQMSASLLLMVSWAWWLFAPLIRSVERSKAVEIEHARLESLEDSLQAKSEFLSRVSHELRSPLQGVVSAIDLFEERYIKDAAEAELVAQVRRGATALNTQLRDLLTLARGDVGKMEINPMRFEVGELAVTIARQVGREAAAKGLELLVDTPEEPIFVVADPARIDQVLTNLLTNATRHTKVGTVTLRLHPYDATGSSLHFEVVDTGPGIDSERIPTLFDPYTRFGEMTSKGEGAGLGLAIVRSVLQFLGGTVTVSSERGKGTVFDVRIPAELLDGERPPTDPARVKRVLVVDDRKEVLDAIGSVVRQLGFHCDTALTVATAANLLGARAYDTVFLDLDMPIKSGFDVASETRRGNGPNARSRIVSISAADVRDERRGWPFDSHLTKPITMQAIQRAIAQPTLASTAPR